MILNGADGDFFPGDDDDEVEDGDDDENNSNHNKDNVNHTDNNHKDNHKDDHKDNHKDNNKDNAIIVDGSRRGSVAVAVAVGVSDMSQVSGEPGRVGPDR